MVKRRIFIELMGGVAEMKNVRLGKVKLRGCKVEAKPHSNRWKTKTK